METMHSITMFWLKFFEVLNLHLIILQFLRLKVESIWQKIISLDAYVGWFPIIILSSLFTSNQWAYKPWLWRVGDEEIKHWQKKIPGRATVSPGGREGQEKTPPEIGADIGQAYWALKGDRSVQYLCPAPAYFGGVSLGSRSV